MSPVGSVNFNKKRSLISMNDILGKKKKIQTKAESCKGRAVLQTALPAGS